MSIPHAAAGVAANLQSPDELLPEAETFVLVKNESFEAIRMAVRKDCEVCHNHHVPGPITIQCLKGCVALTAYGETHSLKSNQWTFLPGGVPHTINGVEDSLVLLTIIFREGKGARHDNVGY
ncbi:hypothetical protein Mal15_18680 [Stieleria maiorica]|uniref:Cupin domain protein n=1 Tax=Stieleria maiorica TaxID=2795974 RepID=A0A5B9MAU5_9BACT|nr:hypothetical protein [Stieleria maiorica]QEF97823.1 hypothetical protein Mal15_18680 [Stieleria maiorica]